MGGAASAGAGAAGATGAGGGVGATGAGAGAGVGFIVFLVDFAIEDARSSQSDFDCSCSQVMQIMPSERDLEVLDVPVAGAATVRYAIVELLPIRPPV